MRTHQYPSDVSDEQWALIEPHLPPAPPGGRPRKTDMRDVLDAVFYILRTGCQWRYLPGDLPPKSTVWRYFDQWRRDGTLDAIHDRLRRKVRAAEKPYHPRTTASVDSQAAALEQGNAHARTRATVEQARVLPRVERQSGQPAKRRRDRQRQLSPGTESSVRGNGVRDDELLSRIEAKGLGDAARDLRGSLALLAQNFKA